MKEVASEADQSRKDRGPTGMAYAAFSGFVLLLLLPAFFFSLGPLINTRGRAWEYEPVRELFIVSVVIFVLFVLAPLAAAYRQSKGRKQ